MQKIAVVGLGAMGRRIARRLLEAGHKVTVWNRTPGPAVELAEEGAVAAGTAAEAASRAEAVIILVSDPQALMEVVEGADGVAAGAQTGTVVVQMSTVDPATIDRVARALPLGVDLLDAPVLGSVAEAESGSLKIFLGGSDRLIDRTRSLLAVLGSPLHVGGLGAGAAAKLVANNVLFGVLAVLGESLSLGRSLGVPQGRLFDVLDATPLAAQAQRRRTAIDTGEYPARFAMSLARKDARLIAGIARTYGVDLRLAAAALSWFESAVDAGLGDQDYSAVLGYVVGHCPRN
jgi:3-hydroxyisobutyrate dehydrogenase/2-hydroxy-3-oxopropionate reductase